MLDNNYSITTSSVKKILGVSLLCLLVGHLALEDYFSNQMTSLFGLFLIFLIIYRNYINKNDIFGFILVIFICSHFRFGVSKGGIFNIIIPLFILFLILEKRKIKEVKTSNKALKLYLWIFIISNFIGWYFKNPMSKTMLGYGILSFFGYIFIFTISNRLMLTKERLNTLIRLFVYISGYLFFVSLNQHIKIITLKTPLLVGTDIYSSFTYGTFGDSELFAEYSLLIFLFLTPFLLSSLTQNEIKVNRKIIIAGIIFSLINLLLTGSRSAFILLFVSLFILFIYKSAKKVKYFNKNYLPYAIFVFCILFFINIFLNIDYVLTRMSKLNYDQLSVESIVSGKEINRAYAFSFALDRFRSDSWYVGYGWGTNASNRTAWFINPEVPRADYHSLYLSLPMLFGWIGAVSFILIILNTLANLIKIFRKLETSFNYLILPVFGFILLLVFFLINEYKINAMRWPQYFMIVWIWLGLANSVINTYKYQLLTKLNHSSVEIGKR